MHLVKPSPGIYRSLERNEVAFGEEGGGRSDSHSGQRSGSGGGTSGIVAAPDPNKVMDEMVAAIVRAREQMKEGK